MSSNIRRYLLVRFLTVIPTVFILLTLIFFILRVLPGDPILAMVGQKVPPEVIQKLRAEAGLDKPLYVQYVHYLAGILKGDFGHSLIWGKRPVLTEIMEKFPATLELSIFSFVFSVILGIFTGSLAAFKKGTKTDTFLRMYGILTYTLFIPWFGMVLQIIFGVYLKLLPIGGRIDPGLEPVHITGLYILDSLLTFNFESLESACLHLLLPGVTLGIVLSGAYTRLVRNNLIEILNQDFILAYKARGISEVRIIYHSIKNAFIPIITLMGLQFAILLAGAVLTETTFSWPGIGTFLLERIQYRDYPCVQGVIVFYALFVALISLIVDIIYALLDPRVKY
ncbi:binding-protein-dependent transport systems inner membrane component [Thermodesulfatator indicus DSM 15286]|uniref:Binding-protein-dependent transport systems inner membrane component n=1 Tax=Thermodesulfatator indicus (strain DSM 15286 / JCM 11887 / CIR29812) TaxID=667014 RepID=F8ADI2_THEID|nr:ABC transporter permease [Thermodesulfatator indicus]AEH44856.1 binding-protein-dependent transport systems inner membrane component [Thermodesulfatator indicus DSM 15286]